MTSLPRILHILDDEIISASVIELFKNLPYDNHYLVLSNDRAKYKHIHNATVLTLESSNLRSSLNQAVEDYDIIYLQALSFEKARLLAKNKWTKKVFVWCLWGYDLYNAISYKTKDRSLLTNRDLKSKLTDYYTYNRIYPKAFQKIDICLFLLESDFQLLKSYYKTSAEWSTGSYQAVDHMPEIGSPTGSNILTGNSSTASNRHNFVFQQLEGLVKANRNVICPLNYGDLTYRNSVISEGKQKFDNQFTPILDFMAFTEYSKVLQSCSHVIFGHKRQQAFGTILQVLLQGSRVYLSEESPFYSYFKNLGIHIYSLENDLKETIDLPLDPNFVLENQQRLRQLFSQSKLIEKMKTIQDAAIEKWRNKN